MATRRRGKRPLQIVTIDWIRAINRLIPYRPHESISARSDKLAIAIMGRFLGPDWVEKHITKNRKGFLRDDHSTPLRRETQRMRRVVLGEMLYNLQVVRGFDSVIGELAGGQIESAYGALEIARMLVTYRLDKGMAFRFVTPSRILRRDYDLSLKFSDGIVARAETKCKMEETKITLRTIEDS
jgi:hypothetical protein